MSNRGGARRGAGRKPLLNLEQSLEIAAESERLFREVREQRRNSDFANKPGVRKMSEAQDKITRVPAERRAEFARSGKLEEARRSVEAAVREAKGTPQWFPQTYRGFEKASTRPKGVWASIDQAVADHYSITWSLPIGPRMVKRCRDEIRKLAKETQPDV